MTTTQRLFLDANVWFAAAASRTGASAYVLTLCKQQVAQVVSSRLVLLEAERNIQAKLGSEALLQFYQDLSGLDVDIGAAPTAREIAAQAMIIRAKDAHVIASALKGAVHALLTLDRRDFFVPSVLEAGLPFEVMTPGDFLRRLLRDRR